LADDASPVRDSARVRVPNTVRTARMRQKLIQATIDCLSRYGYHATSTNVVIAHAGVSRGALLHQFSTKADLMIAVCEYIREHRREAHAVGLEGVSDPHQQLDKLVDILWSEMKDPTGVARIEIMLGSRSDAEFAGRFSTLNQELELLHKDRMWVRAQALGFSDRKLVDALTQLYAAAMRGLAIDATQSRASPDIEAAVQLMKRYHRLLVADQTGG
jgi:AcrR family transcriptional regulator